MYDIFYVSKTGGIEADWQAIKSKYPLAQRLLNISCYEEIKNKAFTKMFWTIWDDIDLTFDLNLTEYTATKWDDQYVHVFKNGDHYDGICLFSKDVDISKKEFHHRFFTNKKEIDIVASTPKKYRCFSPSTYEEYQLITDEMFWVVWSEVTVTAQSVLDLYFSHHNSYDRRENHVFKNLCNDSESYLNGIILCSKYKPISRKEFEKRYIIDKKEHDIVASKFQYPIYNIDSYEEYLKIVDNETQPMFWCVWPQIKITDETVFDLYFDPTNGANDFDKSVNHVFKNSCNGADSYLSGCVLFSKQKTITRKEFDRKYLIDKKEHNVIVSKFQYPIYNIDSYEEYKTILEKESSPMFWCVWPEIQIVDETVFDLYFNSNDGRYDFDRNVNHVFLNEFTDGVTNYHGAMLFSKSFPISKKEITYRAIIESKQHAKLISKNSDYDIVFISYQEPNAEENYADLIKRFPNAKRVHGVKGIHQAHITAAEIASTTMFWAVDGDAKIDDDFTFGHKISRWEKDIVHVWRSQNPINQLIYGYGGVKLLPTSLTRRMDITKPDMTTSISEQFKAMEMVSNVTAFNTDPFNTWKSAFRECVKLSSRTIARQFEEETLERLEIWCTAGADKEFGEYAIKGALEGKKFGEANKHNPAMLSKINDFDWLKRQYGI